MGRILHRLLFRHNIGKLALGQFLLVFAVLILDPYPVHDVHSWDVMDPYPFHTGTFDEFRAGRNPLNNSSYGVWYATPRWETVLYSNTSRPCLLIDDNATFITVASNTTGPDLLVNSTATIVMVNATNDTITVRTTHWTEGPSFFLPTYANQAEEDPWVDVGSVELRPRTYEVWVLRPATRDGRENYQVTAGDGTSIDVREPRSPRTRERGGETFHLDCTFDVEERGEYRMRAERDALRSSLYMMVVPEKHIAYPLAIIIGWLLIAQVVVVKGYGFLRWLFDTTDGDGRDRHRHVFPPDVAHFFAMGPQPNWKGGAFFRFPRGTGEFFEWRPLELEFPQGMAEFLDRWSPPSEGP